MPSKEDIVWSFTNENASSVLVIPVARLYRVSQDSCVAFGDEVTGDYCAEAAGRHQRMIDGWIRVDPNNTITVYSRPGVLAEADRVAYRYHLTDIDRSFDFIADWRFWDRHQSPRIISTDPVNNAWINWSLSVITVSLRQGHQGRTGVEQYQCHHGRCPIRNKDHLPFPRAASIQSVYAS